MRAKVHRVLSSGVALLALACAGSGGPTRAQPQLPADAPRTEASPEAFRNQRPGPGTPGELVYPSAQQTRLKNGLTVVHVRRPSGVVSMSVVVRAGASGLSPKKSGLSAFAVRMMTEGTKTLSSLELAKKVENLGSQLEHDAGRDSVRLGLTVLKEDFDEGLGLLSDVIKNPAFSQTETARIRGEWLDSLEAERQDPSRLAVLSGFRLLLGPTVGAPVRGSRSDVARFDPGALTRFHRERFRPQNAALLVTGDLDFSEVEEGASRWLDGWAARSQQDSLEPPKPEQATIAGVHIVDRPGAVQTSIFAGQPMPARGEPGFEAREVFNNVVGGLFTSRLNTNLRETHGYTYGVRSSAVATRSWGAFVVMTSVRTDVTGDALREIVTELGAAKDPAAGRPIAPDEIERARADLIQRKAAGLQETSSVRDEFESLFVYDLPPDYLARYPTLLRGIDRAAIEAEASRLRPDGLTLVVVGDRAQIERQLVAKGFAVHTASSDLTD